MKKLLVFLTILFSFLNTFATDYYVSNSGSDGANGALATPWATTSKVNSMMGSLVSGDRVLFERGGTFFGTLTVSKAGVTIGAYGSGNLPVITGFKTLTGWTTSGTNLWTSASSNSPKSYMRVVTIDGVMTRMGRFPDWADNASAWRTYTTSIPTSSPATVNFSGTMPTSFVGGELVLRKESYIMDVMPILSQATSSFSCTNPSGLYGIHPSLSNYGFFIQNHPATLTSTNEWYFDPSFKTLTIYGTTSPTTTIRGAVFDTLVNVTAGNVTVENLDIQGSNRFGVITNGSASNFTLRNSIVRFIGYWGVQIGGSSTTILNNLVRDIGSNAIWMANSGLVQGNQIKNVYTIDGMGGSGGDQGFGAALEGNGITCRNNIVDSMGYMGIKIGGGTNGNNILIRENVVSNVCMNKNDGGAIYSYGANGTWNQTNRVIKRNVLINNGKIIYGVGGGTLSTAYFPMYTDGSAGNIIIDSNVIAYDNVGQNAVSPDAIGREDDPAILMNNPRNITLTNNITFGFPKSLLVSDWAPSISGTPKPTGNTIKNNALYVNSMPNGTFSQQVNESFFWISQGSVGVTQMQTDMQNIGVMDSNIVSDHTQAPFHWTSYSVDGAFPVKLAAWRTFSGKDLNSTSFPSGTPDFQVNTTGSPITYSFPGLSKVDFKGVVYNNSAIIPAYYANIFFNVGSAPPPTGRYYVSNLGNDANNGLTPSTAWATIAKVNSSMASFNAGDSILFEKGGTFVGTLNVAKSGIIFSAYGSGNKPIITGFYTIPSWTNTGTNLWSATIPSGLNNVRLLTLNDRVIRPGRFPDYADNSSAWLRYTGQLPATSSVTVASTTAINTNLADGELVLFKNNWNLDVMPITGITGNNITCTNPGGLYGIAANAFANGNWGFFVQNSVNALNQQNEWAYNNNSKIVTMYSTTNPSTLGTIKIPRQTALISLGTNSNVTLDNLDIQGCSEKAITGTGSGITIKNCNVRFVQGWGIDLRGANFNIQNNWVRDIGSNGIWITQSGNITGNTVETCGNIEGLAGLTSGGLGNQGNQDNQHTGIEIETGNTSVVNCSNNIIDSTGYAGIRYYGSNITIEKNFITYPCIAKSDGGGIYSWDNDGGVNFTNRRVKNNVILNSGKFLFGTSTPGLNTQGYGIYCDAGTSNVLIDSNVIGPSLYSPNAGIQGCTSGSITNTEDDAGIYLNGGKNLTLRENIVFGWPQSIAFWRYGQVPALANVTGMRIVGNALYTNPVGSDLCTYNTSFRYYTYDASTVPQIIAQIQGFGVMDSNFIANSTSPFMYKGNAANPGGPVTLDTWRTNTGKDLNSVNFPTTTPDFQFNETATPKTYSFPGLRKIDYRGVVYNNSAVIPAFYGNIFFPAGTATVGNLSASSSIQTSIACNGGTGTVVVSASGGTPPYTGTGAFSRTAGTYTFTVTDAATLTPNTATTTIVIPQPATLTATSAKTDVLCHGAATGTISVTPTGGTAPYTYNWGGGVTTQNRTGIPAGNYICTVTDSRGCTVGISQTITQPTPITAADPTAPAITVNKGTTTITQPTPTGGVTNNSVSTSVDITELPGTLTVQGEVPTEPKALLIDNNPNTKWVDFASADPTTRSSWIQYTLSGAGQIVTSYTLTSGGDLPERDPSNWNLMGSNNGGITWVTLDTRTGETFASRFLKKTYTISNTTAYTTYRLNITRVSAPSTLYCCVQLAEIEFIRSNTTTSGYEYRLNTGAYQSSNVFSNVSAGAYTITIKDANQCTINKSITLTEPGSLSAMATSTSISCNGGSATVTVMANGGVPPYTGTGNFSRAAGSYAFSVTDASGATATTSIVITQPTALVATANQTNLICAGQPTGTITLSPSGGTGTYTYLWNTGQTTQNRTGLAAGIYNVTITDANACAITRTVTITEPPALITTGVASPANILCNGGTSFVTISASGGVSPYSGTGSFTQAAGTVVYSVKDANGCSATRTITLTQPTPLISGTPTAPPILVNGGTTTITQPGAGGGVAPYQYSLNTGTYQTSNVFTGVLAGTYLVNTRDANGCIVTKNLIVSQPNALKASGTAGTIDCNGGTTTVNVGATGGIAPYTGTGVFTRSAGTNQFIVTDNVGTKDTINVVITQPAVLTAAAVTYPAILVFGDSTTVTQPNPAGGTSPYVYSLDGGIYQFSSVFSKVGAGAHTISVKDAKGCIVTNSFTITQPTALTASCSVTAGIPCKGGTTVVTVTASGGVVPYTGTGTFTKGAGLSVFTITDANGAKFNTSINLAEPSQLNAVVSTTPVTCVGGNSSVTVNGNGGTAPYSGTGVTTRPAGTYNYTITDARGCTQNATVIINDPVITPNESF